MKKFIYISGIASANLMFLGSMCKVQHWPGANIFLVLAVFLFCFVFLPVGLYQSYKNSTGKKYGLLYVVSFIVFFIVFISALFKVLHWPGAGLLLLIGIPIPFILFLPVYIIQTRKDKNYSMINFMGIMFGLIFLAVYSSMLSINVSGSVLRSFEKQYYTNLNKVISLYSNKENNIENVEVIKKGEDLCEFIDNLKKEILFVSGNDKDEKMNNSIYGIDNSDVASRILINDEKYSSLDELKVKVKSFREALLSSENSSLELKTLANKLLDVDYNLEPEKQDGRSITWENKEFLSYHMIIVMDALTRLESNVKFIEKELQ